jgi:acylphosphatase
VIVRGRVQGVWFRDSCAREAARLGATGWVRNLADGSVECEFEGEPETVQQMVEWCRRGPPRALVTRVEVFDEEPAGDRWFDVR